MSTAKQPKSILKNVIHPAKAYRADRNREIALYHANIIQQRRDFELEILLSTETLIDYPLAPLPFDSSHPSPVDFENFKKLIWSFQPSDYDALILERNINERCGYALCPNRRNKDESLGKYRLIGTNGKAKDFKVVKKEDLEKWCSDICGKRALYIRVQLNETPVWERAAAAEFRAEIDLLPEPNGQDISHSMNSLRHGIENKPSAGSDTRGLPVEKEGVRDNISINGRINVNIHEKESAKPAQPPSLVDCVSGMSHLILEGYTTSDSVQIET